MKFKWTELLLETKSYRNRWTHSTTPFTHLGQCFWSWRYILVESTTGTSFNRGFLPTLLVNRGGAFFIFSVRSVSFQDSEVQTTSRLDPCSIDLKVGKGGRSTNCMNYLLQTGFNENQAILTENFDVISWRSPLNLNSAIGPIW